MTTPFHLHGKTILVTGASSGIGREAAKGIAAMGGRVIATGRDELRLNDTLRLLGSEEHSALSCDLTDEVQVNNLVENLPSLNGIVHSAGIVKPMPVKFIGKKQVEEIHRINYLAPVLLTAKLFKVKKIHRNASIVFMSSISARHPHKGGALYAAAKAGIEAFSKTIALEHAPQGIRSNCISAAMVRTPLFDNAEKAISKELMDAHGERYPLGFGEPEDISNAIVFLLSGASKWITGTSLVMDGGLTAGH
jgi:NAD(P)-dependent dehydrogenase (short-subunit alcohol dehydrogenase family)